VPYLHLAEHYPSYELLVETMLLSSEISCVIQRSTSYGVLGYIARRRRRCAIDRTAVVYPVADNGQLRPFCGIQIGLDFWLMALVSRLVTGTLLEAWRSALDFGTAILAIGDAVAKDSE